MLLGYTRLIIRSLKIKLFFLIIAIVSGCVFLFLEFYTYKENISLLQLIKQLINYYEQKYLESHRWQRNFKD